MSALRRLADKLISLAVSEPSPPSPTGSLSPKRPKLGTIRDKLFGRRHGKKYIVQNRDCLSSGLESIMTAEILCDLAIFIEGDQKQDPLYAHSCILATQSEYFRNKILQAHQNVENNYDYMDIDDTIQRRIIVSEVSYTILCKILKFLYSGKIQLRDDDVIDVFMAANLLGVNELKSICCTHMQSAISCDSLHLLLQESRRRNAAELETKCIHFFQDNVVSALQSESLLQISEELLILLLCKDFWVPDEILVFEFIVRWGKRRRYDMSVEHGVNASSISLKEVISRVVLYVRLISLSRAHLERKVIPLNVVDEDLLIEVLFHQLQYGLPEPPRDTIGDPWATDEKGNLVKFYMRPRKGRWKVFAEFESEAAYAEYLKSVIEPGMLMRAVSTYEQVAAGDIGEFVQYNAGIPPCQVRWQRYGNTYWLYWKDVELV